MKRAYDRDRRVPRGSRYWTRGDHEKSSVILGAGAVGARRPGVWWHRLRLAATSALITPAPPWVPCIPGRLWTEDTQVFTGLELGRVRFRRSKSLLRPRVAGRESAHRGALGHQHIPLVRHLYQHHGQPNHDERPVLHQSGVGRRRDGQHRYPVPDREPGRPRRHIQLRSGARARQRQQCLRRGHERGGDTWRLQQRFLDRPGSGRIGFGRAFCPSWTCG